MTPRLDRRDVQLAITAGRGGEETASALLAHCRAATGTGDVPIWMDVRRRFTAAVEEVLEREDPREKLVLAYLLDGDVELASERYEKLIAADEGRAAELLYSKAALFLPTHPAIARDAFRRLLDLAPGDLHMTVGLGLATGYLGEAGEAAEIFVEVLAGFDYLDHRRGPAAARMHLADRYEAYFAGAAWDGLWRARFDQQCLGWSRAVFEGAVESFDRFRELFPRLSRNIKSGDAEMWDLHAAAAITVEASHSMLVALDQQVPWGRITDVLLAPSVARRELPPSVTRARAEAFDRDWHAYRRRLFGLCWEHFQETDHAAAQRRLEAALGDDLAFRQALRDDADAENTRVASWVLGCLYQEMPRASEDELAALGRTFERIAQRWAVGDSPHVVVRPR